MILAYKWSYMTLDEPYVFIMLTFSNQKDFKIFGVKAYKNYVIAPSSTHMNQRFFLNFMMTLCELE